MINIATSMQTPPCPTHPHLFIGVQARKLRMEASSKDRILAHLNANAQRAARLSDMKAAQLSERQAKREAAQNSAREAREACDISRKERAIRETDRCVEAALKRKRLIQSTIDKSAHEVKQALARAASAKERERELAVCTGEKINLKLEQAEDRRIEILSPRNDKLSPTERARQAAAALRVIELKTEEKRRSLSLSLGRASEKRQTFVDGVASRAGDRNRRVEEVAAEARAQAECSGRTARRNLFLKLNEADVRRQSKRAASHAKGTGEVIEVRVHSETPPAPPVSLLARLCAPSLRDRESAVLAALLASRHHAASKRAAAALASRTLKARLDSQRVRASFDKRAHAASTRQAATELRHIAAAHLVADACRARLAFAKKANLRVSEAALRRSSFLAAKKHASYKASLKRAAVAGRRAMSLFNVSRGKTKERADLSSARRATSYELIVARGADLSAKCVHASAAREKFLLGRSSKAHFGTIPRRTPAKLTKDGGVLLTSPPTTPPVTDPQAENSLAMMKYGFRLWYSLSKARPAAAAADEPAPDEDEWQVVDAAP